MGLSIVIILAFIRREGAAGFLITEHTVLNLSYSAFLNMSYYRSCNKERTGKSFREE